MMAKIEQPNNHDWFCDCEACEKYWAEIACDECDGSVETFNYEHERELDRNFEMDGWGNCLSRRQ